MTEEFDEAVIQCFLIKQRQLFPEDVVENEEEAEAFLEDSIAVVVNSPEEVLEYFENEGIDVSKEMQEDILDQSEVFDVGDGRYLIVEG